MVLARIGASVVLKTSSAREALAAIERDQPRLLTLELDTQPGEPDGFEVIRRATALSPSLRAIVLSTHHDAAHIDGALGAGAAAYVVKTAHPDDVASAVRQAFDHSVYLPGGPLAVGEPLDPEAQPARGERPGGLTRRELEILRLVAEGHSNSGPGAHALGHRADCEVPPLERLSQARVTNRTEASRWAQVNGLLGDELSLA